MSAETEKIFGQNIEKYAGDDFKGNLDQAHRIVRGIFTGGFNFLKHPKDAAPHDKMQELADIALALLSKPKAVTVLVNPDAEIDDLSAYFWEDGRTQVQVPPEFVQIVNDSPTEGLLFAVGIASMMRDNISNPEGGDLEDMVIRATIFQAEFLLWWQKVAGRLGVSFEPDFEHKQLLRLYPEGIMSESASKYYDHLTKIIRPKRSIIFADGFAPLEARPN